MPTLGSPPEGRWTTETVRTYSSFSGADIVASLGNKVFGNIQSITYAVQREIAPVHVMGSAKPVAYARGKRAITGSLVFVTFDRDALIYHMRAELAAALKVHTDLKLYQSEPLTALSPAGKWGSAMVEAVMGLNPGGEAVAPAGALTGESVSNLRLEDEEAVQRAMAHLRYVDQIPPFDVTISFLNELGNTAHMRIEGVQLLNGGMGMSIDDVVLEQAVTFIARTLRPLTPNLWWTSSEYQNQTTWNSGVLA